MVIDGLEYYIGLYIMDEDDFPEYEAHFVDFLSFNAYIRQNIDNSKYLSCQMCYSIVEAIDGEPGSFSWVNKMQWHEFSDEQIQKEIDDFIEYETYIEEHTKKVDEFSREIHYYPGADNYRKKQAHFNDISYVCPRCIRELEDCRCAEYPYYLVQIDRLMVPIIRELNAKGYRTSGCCAGHPTDDEFSDAGIYIAFAEEYDFDEPFPDGGKYSKSRHTLYYTPTVEGSDNLVTYQQSVLDELLDWAESLFEVGFFDSEFDND